MPSELTGGVITGLRAGGAAGDGNPGIHQVPVSLL
jgi:hypothetical protein